MLNSFLSVYEKWVRYKDLDSELKEELNQLKDEKEIEDRFYRHLAFGTGGLRGIIGAGTNRINRYTIRRATAGLARFLIQNEPNAKQMGVVIAYDSRHKSPDFAEEAAGVLAYYGIPSYLYAELRPTPMLSFAVRELKAAAGIVITASHNPPEYNGYKVYGSDGGQIPPATADQILDKIEQVDNELTIPFLPLDEGRQKGLFHLLGEEMDKKYTSRLLSLSLNPGAIEQVAEDLNVVFTPLHGTGNKPLRRVLKEMGLTRVHVVKEQEHPDPRFSTVASPNPEERQAFEMALQDAKKYDADIIIGTDPDADRVGVVVKDRSGAYQILNGNQTGALLLYYLLSQKKKLGKLPKNGVMIKTIVTSGLGKEIASSFDVTTVDTLTGFKFIGEKIKEYETTGEYSFLFGYEESYGYLIGSFVRDKDAIQAGMMACEMAAYYKTLGMTLYEALEEIYQKYGYYQEDLISFTFKGREGQEKISSIIQKLRRQPLSEIEGVKVRAMEDYQKGIKSLPKSNVLKYVLEDGSWIAVRPSGTEPKIKFYFSAVASTLDESIVKLELLKNYILKLVNEK